MKLTEEQKELLEWMIKERFFIGIPEPFCGRGYVSAKIEAIEEYFTDILAWKAKQLDLKKEEFIEIELDLEERAGGFIQCFATTNKGERCKRGDGRWSNLILSNPKEYLRMKHDKEFLCPKHRGEMK